MSIISVEFVILFAFCFFLYHFLPGRYGLLVLLVFSLLYLHSSLEQVVVIVFSILLDYFILNGLIGSGGQKRRGQLLALGLLHNIALLVLGKSSYLLGFDQPVFPIGMSFFVITKMGYLLDAYAGRDVLGHKIGEFGVFSLFFLTISSGPIERARHLIPQLRSHKKIDHVQIVVGLRRVLIGLFKKVVVAENLSVIVDHVYSQPENFSGLFLVIASVTFAFQLYADFSGYTDIVLGLGKMLGLELFENFRQPYFAVSILDFWKRWHISLTNWIRDFMFFPLTRFLLGGNIPIPLIGVQAFVYLVVMSVVGLWHGSGVTFLIWGGLHGLYMTIETLMPVNLRQLDGRRSLLRLRVLVTFMLVCFAWIWFRADSFESGWYIATHLVQPGNILRDYGALPQNSMLYSLLGIAIMLVFDSIERTERLEYRLGQVPVVYRWGFYYALFIPVFFRVFTNQVIGDFVYFRF